MQNYQTGFLFVHVEKIITTKKADFSVQYLSSSKHCGLLNATV